MGCLALSMNMRKGVWFEAKLGVRFGIKMIRVGVFWTTIVQIERVSSRL